MQIEKVKVNLTINCLGYLQIDDKTFACNYFVYINGNPAAAFFFEHDAINYVESCTKGNETLLAQFKIVESV